MAVKLRAVIDTNVLFEGITQRGGACGLLVDAWLAGLFRPYVSDSLCYEYFDVLARKLSPRRFSEVVHLVDELLKQATFCEQHFIWRPIASDAGDDHVVSCAINASAILVTWNTRDFRAAAQLLGVRVMRPPEFLRVLLGEEG
jgi:predicted nucleic acid-binding protein